MFNFFISAFKKFNAGVFEMNWFWKLWLLLMVVVLGICPLLFLPKFSAIIVLVGVNTGFILGLILTNLTGFNKLLGLMHTPWIPMFCYLLYFLMKQDFQLSTNHDYWVASAMVISGLSLIIDTRDVYLYLCDHIKGK